MRRTPFNDGWTFRPKVDRFAELSGAGAEWEPVTLPHDAVIGTDRSPDAGPATGYFPGGAWEYRRTLERGAEGSVTTMLELEGVYRDAVVTVNGSVAGHRPSGYSGFVVPLDHLLTVGENEVKVEATAHADSRWYSGGGIYRNVWLLEAGPVHLMPDHLEVLTPEVDDAGAVVTVTAVVRNRGAVRADAVVHAEVLDADGTVVASQASPVTVFPGATVTARQRLFVAGPRRWGPDDPCLYSCRATLREGDEVVDEDRTTFGIRTLALDPRQGLRINGEPVLLRGACVHHDNGPIGAATLDRAEARRVELLKDAGFNAIRSAHNPLSRAMLDACDRLGVLVMDETFDIWAQTKSADDYSLRFDDWWEADVEAMVRKDVNHPSVILYCIGNEIPDGSTATGLQRSRALAEKVRSLDPTRFVTQAVTGMLVAGSAIFEQIREVAASRNVDEETGVNTAALNLGELMDEAMQAPVVGENTEEAFAHLDAAGYNYMFTRFEMDGERYPNRVIVATETHPGTVDRGWAGVTGNAHVIGDFTWTGWDYLGEAAIGRIAYGDGANAMGMSAFHGDYPWLAAWCGDLDITGHRRPQSYYREIVFGLRTDPYVAVLRPEHHGKQVEHASPWAWSDVVSSWSWAGDEGKPVVVEVYADADEVELLVNGGSLGRQPAGPDHRFKALFDTSYEPGELEAVAWRAGAEIGRLILRSADGPVRLEAHADRTEISADPSDLAFVEVSLVDEAGTVVITADRLITVGVEGSGVLQGLASARPATEEPYTGSTCTTFDGRALAVIRPTGTGTITVRVTADDVEAQELRIRVS
jgi:beta-galactosidase